MIRRWGAALLAAVIAGLPLAPQEHVHEREHDGDPQVLVHRHADAHAVAHHDHDADQEGVLDDDDAVALAISPVFITASIVDLTSPLVRTALPAMAPVFDVSFETAPYLARPIHGPPRGPTGLRAPPSSSLL